MLSVAASRSTPGLGRTPVIATQGCWRPEWKVSDELRTYADAARAIAPWPLCECLLLWPAPSHNRTRLTSQHKAKQSFHSRTWRQLNRHSALPPCAPRSSRRRVCGFAPFVRKARPSPSWSRHELWVQGEPGSRIERTHCGRELEWRSGQPWAGCLGQKRRRSGGRAGSARLSCTC